MPYFSDIGQNSPRYLIFAIAFWTFSKNLQATEFLVPKIVLHKITHGSCDGLVVCALVYSFFRVFFSGADSRVFAFSRVRLLRFFLLIYYFFIFDLFVLLILRYSPRALESMSRKWDYWTCPKWFVFFFGAVGYSRQTIRHKNFSGTASNCQEWNEHLRDARRPISAPKMPPIGNSGNLATN